MEIGQISLAKAAPLIESYITRGIPFGLFGQPGIGKTEMVMTLAVNKLHYNCRTDFAATKEPGDINGYLLPDKNGEIDFQPFGLLKQILTAKDPLLVFFDEITKAPISVINPIAQLTLSREINGIRIPDCVTFGFAGNRRTDLSGDNPLPEHFKSRLRILHIGFDLPSFNNYMVANDFHDSVIALVNIYPEMLANYKPSRDIEASNVPRNIHYLSNDVKHFEATKKEIAIEAVLPLISSEYAYKYLELREILQSLPDLDEIANGKNPLVNSLSPSACNLILVKLLNKINALSVDFILQWVFSNLQIEQQKLFVELAKVKYSNYLNNSSIFVKWNVINKGFSF